VCKWAETGGDLARFEGFEGHGRLLIEQDQFYRSWSREEEYPSFRPDTYPRRRSLGRVQVQRRRTPSRPRSVFRPHQRPASGHPEMPR